MRTFCQHADIEWAAAQGTLALVPASHVRDGQPAYAPQRGDGPGLAAWRRIMPTPTARLLYGARCRIECLMAQMRQRGLRQFLVRGTAQGAVRGAVARAGAQPPVRRTPTGSGRLTGPPDRQKGSQSRPLQLRSKTLRPEMCDLNPNGRP